MDKNPLTEVPSVTQYVDALTRLAGNMSDLQRSLLVEHYHAPGHAASARELAEATGAVGWQVVNGQYGRLGSMLRDALDYRAGRQQSYAIASFVPPGVQGNAEWVWVMHPQLAEALASLGWVRNAKDENQSPMPRPVATYLLTWNPDHWDGNITNPINWTCGRTKRIRVGDRLFLIRQGREPRGICASGWAVSDSKEDVDGLFVEMQIEVFRNPEAEPILFRLELDELNNGAEQPMKWGIQSSGTQIPKQVAQRLEMAWRELCGDLRLRPDERFDTDQMIEGSRLTVTVNRYERDPEARRRCIAAHGTSCCICGFDFGIAYGEVAEGIIHVHHLRPLSEIGEAHIVNPIRDLRPVCPNCHVVLHCRVPAFSIEEVRSLILEQRHACSRGASPQSDKT